MHCVAASCFIGKYMQSTYNSEDLGHKDKIFVLLSAEESLNMKLRMASWKEKQISSPTTGSTKIHVLCQADTKTRILPETGV